MDQKPIGKVTHYYDKIQVAIVKLQDDLKIGDKLKFVKGENQFEQVIESMQLEHQPVQKGKINDEIAIKIQKPVKEGTVVYLV